MDNAFKIIDSLNRILISVKDGRVLVARFSNMDESEKAMIVDLYEEINGFDSNKIRDFLDYKNDDFDFCS